MKKTIRDCLLALVCMFGIGLGFILITVPLIWIANKAMDVVFGQ